MILLNCLGSSMSVYFFWSFRGQYRVIYMTPEFCSGNLELLQDLDRTVGKLEVRLGELPGSLNWSLCLSLFGNWILLTYFLVRVVTPFIPIHHTRWKKSYEFVWDHQALCYNPGNTTNNIWNSYWWLIEQQWVGKGPVGANLRFWAMWRMLDEWSLDCGGGETVKAPGPFLWERP